MAHLETTNRTILDDSDEIKNLLSNGVQSAGVGEPVLPFRRWSEWIGALLPRL